MKAFFLSLFAAISLGAVADDYTYLEVVTSGNCITDVELAPIQKITFARGEMVVTSVDGTAQQFALASIDRLYFSSTPDPVESVEADPSAAVTAIYTIDGRRLPTRNVEALPGGVYVVKRADGSSIKIGVKY